MIAKPNAIEELPVMNSGLRVQGMGGPVAQVVLVRVVPTQHGAPSARAHVWIGLRSADDWAGEFWETLSYAVIWLCGLIGIGLCLR